MSVLTAVCGGLMVIQRFAFRPSTALWIAFGLAIVALACSLVALATALTLTREKHLFAALSALTMLVSAVTIIATRTLGTAAALWITLGADVVFVLVAVAIGFSLLALSYEIAGSVNAD
ncbi:MAG: hypothetical protein ACRDKL_02645 [Solirubrobacteraceae bacterium]